jgi:hypothetical protein
MTRYLRTGGITILLAHALAGTLPAQLAPEIGYMHPSGAPAGTTVNVTLGGYDWTPDMQLFVHDPRVKLEIIGPRSEVLVPEPPYWFGYKARGYAWPLPREYPARLTIPNDVPPGPIQWQVANANGASPVGTFFVGGTPEVIEDSRRKEAQELPALPITVSGQIRLIEEVDRYRFRVPQTGPVTIELVTRPFGSMLHGMLQVRDPEGRVVLDAADTEGKDLVRTMIAQADTPYEVRVHDLDFAGDRSYVYRLTLSPGPHVSAVYPAAGRRGETRSVEFVGIGLATGSPALESVTREVTFPTAIDVRSFSYSLETPFGKAKPCTLLVSDLVEHTEASGGATHIVAPAAVTGHIESRFGSDRFSVELKKGDKWEITALASAIGSPLDLQLQVLGSDGKQIAINDDEKGSTDASLSLIVPADGTYQIVVSDLSGKSGSRAANYRLSIEPAREGVSFTVPGQLPIVVGGTAKLVIKAVREGGFTGPIPVTISGLPAGVTVPADLVIPEKKNDLSIDLTCAADAATAASLCTITATPTFAGKPSPREIGKVLIAIIMQPRIKLTPEGLDDVSKVHRGSTHLFPFKIERLEGFTGPLTLEMTAKQQRHRQGLRSEEMVVPADASRIEYPIFVPEWMETTKTSRMILNGSVQVPDPKGNVRTLLQRQELRLGILPEGALMKLSHSAGEPVVTVGGELTIPLALSLASELRDPIQITLVPSEAQKGLLTAEPLALSAGQKEAALLVRIANDASLVGDQPLTVRATTLRNGYPVISETTVLLVVKPR